MAHPAYQLKKAKNNQYYFTLTAKNGQVILQSNMHPSKGAATLALESVRKNAPVAEIDDQSKNDGVKKWTPAELRTIPKDPTVKVLNSSIDEAIERIQFARGQLDKLEKILVDARLREII